MAVMEHSAAAHHWVTEAAALAAKEQGAGNLLRVVLIVMVVGCVLVAWFLLRGYRQGADTGRSADTAEAGEDRPAEAGENRPGGSGGDDRADHNG
ncbi:hypothetical protein GCM10010277_17990 [Streptomyces longisporoflavus]|uniref:hypothetical protein n=1 Tax=Streptomyces longisporoflavus TaxID=28044 RepID=UPI00167E08F9|nr:hypothetical protein [Streptomyces longisporoflavus]GGV33095.1 hypothetical protein GCM10010277_17990 [Streptomyces longisporoflavus]